MRSMTGFGRADLEQDGVRVAVDARALNHRFFELKLSLPRGWGAYEAEVRKLVQDFVERGRVEVTLRRVSLKPAASRLVVNEQLAGQYIQAIRRLSKRLELAHALTPESILQRPEIFQVVEEDEDFGADIELGRKALLHALKALNAERLREGKALKKDLAERLAQIERASQKIAKLSAASRKAIIESFQSRVRELAGILPLDERRLYEDAVATAQRADISEELVRLRTHLQAFRQLLAQQGAVGRKIDFLLQEINREINTMASKSQNAELSRVAVEAKSELEKIREQVQNVE
ncbi:MAG TPA: YicC/YloC family endoribonuclease [Candidatus Binataceae bacterium]|nr:YicC/YloC family endoribonuclease [Candidatus Binataceae bacterium]